MCEWLLVNKKNDIIGKLKSWEPVKTKPQKQFVKKLYNNLWL